MKFKEYIGTAILRSRFLFLKFSQSPNGNHGHYTVPLREKCRAGWSAGEGEEAYGLIPQACALVGKPLRVLTFNEGSSPIRGYFINKEDEVRIMVANDENVCWKRFLVAKELCHLLMQSETDSLTREYQSINSVMAELLSVGNSDPDSVSEAFKVEQAAYFGAIEMLLPPEFEAKAHEWLDSGSSVHDVATAYRVPRQIVEFRYRNDKIRQIFRDIHETHQYETVSLRGWRDLVYRLPDDG